MAITSLAGVISGLQPPTLFAKLGASLNGNFSDHWNAAGYPPTGSVADATALNGVTLTYAALSGALQYTNPTSGNSYLARFQNTDSGGNFGSLKILADRIWHNGGMAFAATAQAITTPAWPARDCNGATSGDGVFIALEVLTSNVTGGPPTSAAYPTISYTSSAGTAGRTGTMMAPIAPANPQQAATLYPFSLQAGDTGVKSVESVTFPATFWTAGGPLSLVAFRPIAFLDQILPNMPNALDAITGGMQRIYDNSVLFFITLPRSGGGAPTTGEIQFTWG